jgi:acetyl esterase/lipase
MFDPQTVGWLFLGVSLWGAAFTGVALVRGKHLHILTFFYFMAAWLTGELALHHLAWQVLAAAGFVAAGALESVPGRVGAAVTLASWAGLLVLWRRAHPLGHQVKTALAEQLPDADHESPQISARSLWHPFRMARPGVESVRNVPYGDALAGDKGRRNLLDVIRPAEAGEGRPILLQVHGGGWVYGDKENQGQPLMHHLAERGWVSFALNYRLAPKAAFPAQIIDVKRCIAWIREHAHEWGGDPDFICITGGSAGGHLCALAALTANDPVWQPGFETADTRVAACVPFYGVYDLLDRAGHRGRSAMAPFLERLVLKTSPEEDRVGWEAASPVARVTGDAPPFCVVHGTHDSLVFVEEARHFVEELREKSREQVVYLEVPRAQHAFDTFHSVRSRHVIAAVTTFLQHVHERQGARSTV